MLEHSLLKSNYSLSLSLMVGYSHASLILLRSSHQSRVFISESNMERRLAVFETITGVTPSPMVPCIKELIEAGVPLDAYIILAKLLVHAETINLEFLCVSLIDAFMLYSEVHYS